MKTRMLLVVFLLRLSILACTIAESLHNCVSIELLYTLMFGNCSDSRIWALLSDCSHRF